MFLVILSIILSIISVIALSINIDAQKGEKRFKLTKRTPLGMLWLLIIVFGCFTNIGANKVGIAYNPFKGGIQNYTLSQGYNPKSPFTKIYKINTEVNELTFDDISVQTNDSQYVKAIIKVQAKIDTTKAFEYFSKYRDKSLDEISSILSATIQKQMETITTQYNIMDVLGSKRDEIVNKSLELKLVTYPSPMVGSELPPVPIFTHFIYSGTIIFFSSGFLNNHTISYLLHCLCNNSEIALGLPAYDFPPLQSNTILSFTPYFK